VSERNSSANDPAQVAGAIALALEVAGCDYALGGAIALGFWAEPRGTLDVDVTVFLPAKQPIKCVRLLQTIGCNFKADEAIQSLAEHGYCQVTFDDLRIDVFLPTIPFYEQARNRRKEVLLGNQAVLVWDAETLCVFKMMFFRRKDLADVEQILRVGGDQLDRAWVLDQLTAIYGERDPRISQWQELVRDVG
jgi:hypothetical protein